MRTTRGFVSTVPKPRHRGRSRAGLGLALVAVIARLHDARLLLEDNALGLGAVLAFPIARAVTGIHDRDGS